MKTNWDYTDLAEAYLERPNYSGSAIDAMLKCSSIRKGETICDVGAGVAHLSLELALRDFSVKAVEPNSAMRTLGQKRTKHLKNILWEVGVGEATKQPSKYFEMVTFGSSFNVCDPILTLKETARILKPNGWFACLYNNRDLHDPIQAEIENTIKRNLPDYDYGSRRADHSHIIKASSLFHPVLKISSQIIHKQNIGVCVKAWNSHATLARQAGPNFDRIVKDIEEYLMSLGCEEIKIPYQTNIWLAQLK